jgi:hypothetical protein
VLEVVSCDGKYVEDAQTGLEEGEVDDASHVEKELEPKTALLLSSFPQ